MTELSLKIPPNLPALLKISKADFTHEAQVLLAVKLFEMGKLTSGEAAELTGFPRTSFLYTLARSTLSATKLHVEEFEY